MTSDDIDGARMTWHWWLSVELQLDDEAQVPADPATDAVQLARIRGICAAAQH